MIEVTERWSGRRMTLCEPFVASREFDVTGTSDDVAALLAQDGNPAPPGGVALKVPQSNDLHDQNVALYCTGPKIKDRLGPRHYVIQCDYILFNSPFMSGAVNPLLLPTEYTWGTIEVCDQSDHDADGLVICNAVGDVSPQPVAYTLKSLRATKNFATLDASWFALENSVSNAPIVVQGIPIMAQHLRLKQVNPRSFYKGATVVYTVDFDMEVCLTEKLGQSKYPFAHRLLNDTENLWCAKTGGGVEKLVAVGTNKQPLNYRVRLLGSGIPTSDFSSVKVGPEGKAPVVPTNPFPSFEDETIGGPPVGVGAATQPMAVFRYFQKCVRRNLNALPIW